MMIYKDHYIEIVEESRGFWWWVDGRPICFVSNRETAIRLATRFVDVLEDGYYNVSRQLAPRMDS